MKARDPGTGQNIFDLKRLRPRQAREDFRFVRGRRPEQHVSRFARQHQWSAHPSNQRRDAKAGAGSAGDEVAVLFALAAADAHQILCFEDGQRMSDRGEIVHHDQAF